MKIVVQFLAQARVAAGCSEVEVELPTPVDLADAIANAVEAVPQSQKLRAMLYTDEGNLQPWLLITVDGAAIAEPQDVQLQDSACIQIMPPISGG